MNFKRIFIILNLLILSIFLILPTNAFATTDDISTYSPHCILMEASTGKIIYEKDAYTAVPPASTTKIMTAILTLEHCQLTDTATVSHEAIFTVPVGYSHANLVEGEVLTIDQLLHVLLIPSANDAANVLAEHIAGSVSSFCTMMNTKALEIGCKNTNFVNANGIQAENHYTTAYDLALIGRYAMQNETFRQIVSSTRYTLPATNKYPEANRFFNTTNELLKVDNRDRVDNYYYQYCNGIKTGYTDKAKDCIVASSNKDGMEYIVVILGAQRTENGLSGRYLDCKNLFNYAFENYKTYTINEKNSTLKQIKVQNATSSTRNLNVIVEDDITLLLKNDTNISSITPTVEINTNLEAPISKNTVIGTISYNVDGNEYSSNLLAGNDVVKSNLLTTCLTILSIFLVLLLLYKLLNLNSKNKKGKRKNSKKGKRAKKSSNKNGRDNYLYW